MVREVGKHAAVKIESFWFCRSQEPVSMWEEPGSWYKKQRGTILTQWEPVTPREEPGSQLKIYKGKCIFLWEPVPSMEEPSSP